MKLSNTHYFYPARFFFYRNIDIWAPPFQPFRASPAQPGGMVSGILLLPSKPAGEVEEPPS